MTELLHIDGVRVQFGAVRALDDVDLTVTAGTITGLIGPNGAGKTTLIDAAMGFVAAAAGSVHFDGEAITTLLPHQRARRGLARTFQAVELFDDLTVWENILVAAEGCGADRTAARDAALAAGLADNDSRTAASLSPSERKALALARALAGRPRLLLLDEPAAGLDRDERRRLADAIRRIRDTGTTVLLVDHDVDLVLDVCDRVVVLDLGTVVYDGAPAGVRDSERVAAAYLGPASPAAAVEKPPADTGGAAAGDVLVRARAVSCGYGDTVVVRDLDLDVAAGERVALLGPNGAGKTTTLLTLSGALGAISGDLTVLDARPGRPHRQARRGVAHVTQEQKIFASLSVRDNLRLASADRRVIEELREQFPALRRAFDRLAGTLSGGEQQLLALARSMARSPRLLLVDELSLGLAPATVADLFAVLADWQSRSGAAVVFAEQHVDQALTFADRVYVLAAGHLVLHAPAARLRQEPALLAQAYLGRTEG